jgi:dCTP deaminase
MSVLSDKDIVSKLYQPDKGNLIDPFDEKCLQPASYDIHLGESFRKYQGVTPIDPLDLRPNLTREIISNRLLIKPGEFVLGCTQETFNIPRTLVARVEGKSSIGRLGILVHISAGFIDPGFNGTLTLELYNCNSSSIWLSSGMKIAQIAFTQLTQPASIEYGHKDLKSHYQNQTGATESRYGK